MVQQDFCDRGRIHEIAAEIHRSSNKSCAPAFTSSTNSLKSRSFLSKVCCEWGLSSQKKIDVGNLAIVFIPTSGDVFTAHR